MKFEFDGDTDRGECVACLFGPIGDQAVYVKLDNSVMAIYERDGNIEEYSDEIWHTRVNQTTRKFYKGDKITITF